MDVGASGVPYQVSRPGAVPCEHVSSGMIFFELVKFYLFDESVSRFKW